MKKMNNNGFAISTVIYGTFILFIMILAILLASINSSLRLLEDRVNTVNNYEVGSDIEPPDLSTGLIPIIYDKNKGNDTHWFVADISKEWYNYDKQMWANAISVKSSSRNKYKENDNTYIAGVEIATEDMLAMFVWIPRFSYTIGCSDLDKNGTINNEVTTDSVSTECLGYRIEDASNLSTETPGAIDIKFISKDYTDPLDFSNNQFPIYEYDIDDNEMPLSNKNPSNWYTHPAFNFDGNELAGIWVGKFETSVPKSSNCYINDNSAYCGYIATDLLPNILPDARPLVFQETSDQYFTAKKIESNLMYYGLNSNIDSHMTKNSEWSAVAYLSQSIYGKYGNPFFENENKEIYSNTEYRYTGASSGEPGKVSDSTINSYKYDGESFDSDIENCELCGTGASTTGNIYGIYDMSGGSHETVMGNYNNLKGSQDNFDELPDEKYMDIFMDEGKGINIFFKLKEKSTIGHGFYETSSWYNDGNYSSTLANTSGWAWFMRGGYRALGVSVEKINGIFYAALTTGSNGLLYSFRTTLVNP